MVSQMVTEQHRERMVILTSPMSLDGDSTEKYVAPNMLRRVLSLLSNVRPGSDLTRFQLPPLFNLPKSQLQLFGEAAYCIGDNSDVLESCWKGETPLDRFTSVVSWSISTTRPAIFGAAPYNPVLGETHHVSRGKLNFLLEQVSHHPPVSALHATDDEGMVEMLWCHNPVSMFHGASVETEVHGNRELRLLKLRETYVMNCPKLLIRLFPIPGVDWSGPMKITCQDSGLVAELSYGGNSFLGRNRRAINGRIFKFSSSSSSPPTLLYEVSGHWHRTVTMKDVNNGKSTVIYNARDTISRLKAPTVRDPKGISPSESASVWCEVSEAILRKDWEKAGEAKRSVEQKQRSIRKQRDSAGENWVPKHFSLCYNKEDGWNVSPLLRTVPPAPIEVPI